MSSFCTQGIDSTDGEPAEPTLLRWFALVVPPRREKVIGGMLRNKSYETLLPVHIRRHQYGPRARSFEIPLFPGYLFCRFDPAMRLPVLTTPGVLQVVGAGKTPIPVADDELLALRRVMETGAPMIPHEFWQSGRKGRIHSGPLAGIEGIVVNAKPPVRLVLSVSLLQRSVLVEVDADCVSLA
jgi:transcription antitermination factor NusG